MSKSVLSQSAPLLWKFPTADAKYVNWTAASANGDYLVACTFCFDTSDTYYAYCFARDSSTPVWYDAIEADEGVFWVAISADASWAASGGLLSSTNDQGFIRAYPVQQTGGGQAQAALDFRTTGRVNEVELSGNGKWLIGCAGNDLYLFELGQGKQKPNSTFTAPGTVYTIGISEDGMWIVAGMIASESPSGSGKPADPRAREQASGTQLRGQIVLFQNEGGLLAQRGKWEAPWIEGRGTNSYIQRVVMAPDGGHFAAASSNGDFYLFQLDSFLQNPVPLWGQSSPFGATVYGLAISADGQTVVAGSNPPSGSDAPTQGFYSCVRNTSDPSSPTGFSPSQVWTASAYSSPNPGLSMDDSGAFIAAADGHPVGDPGHFYLFAGADGTMQWTYETPNESWPAAISRDGSIVICGSDDGNVYVFQGPLGKK